MKEFKGFRRTVPPHLARSTPGADLDEELQFHVRRMAKELEDGGMAPQDAWEEALRQFGNPEKVRAEVREIDEPWEGKMKRAEWFDSIRQDLRYSVRSLVKSGGFAPVALLTLALGIGANTAIFSVVNGVLMRPLPYEDPDELVWIEERSTTGGTMAVAWANFRDWRQEARSFDGLAAYAFAATTVLGGAEPAWTTAASITEDFWSVFPVVPVAGRLTVPDDHLPGAARVAVVSQAFARDVLGGENVVGGFVEPRGIRMEVVGVVATEFDFPGRAQLWVPLPPQGESRTAHNWSVVGRLRDGVGVETAAQEVDALMQRIRDETAAAEPDEYLAAGTITVSLQDRIVGDTSRSLFILLGAAGLVLLVACTNLASTLLARGTVRARELALRSALGAGRGRLIRQLLTESLILSLAGGAAGLGASLLVLRALRAIGADSVPRLEAVTIDGTVLGFTLVVALVTIPVFGLLPALRGSEGVQVNTLRSESRGNAGLKGRTWGMLVTTEVALALILLVGSGLLIRSFVAVLSEDAGFDAEDVVLTGVVLSGVKYPELDDHRIFWDDMLGRAAAIPGVSATGVISTRPVAGFVPNGRVSLDGDPNKFGDGLYVVASAGAFEALDIPLLQGRLFEESDGPEAPHVVVVSRAFANRHWPGEDPIGKQVSGGGMDNYYNADPIVFGRVVGVVGDVRYRALTRQGEATVYWHYEQRPFRVRSGAILLVESANEDPALVAPALRDAVHRAEPDVAVRLRYMADLVSDSLTQRRFLLLVLGSFAGLALLLSAVGIYGVVSYAVARRTREIGIRMALGAAPASVRSLVLRRALRPVIYGLVVGVGGGLALAQIMQSFLYEVQATDPVTFGTVVVLLLGAAGVASWFPARRGTRVDPMITMRAE